LVIALSTLAIILTGPLYANASNGGKPVKLSGGTGIYTLGVDLLHLNDDVCNSIMSYCWGKGDTVRTPAAWEMGILNEIGWITNIPVGIDKTTAIKIINAYPNPVQNIVEFSGSLIQSIAIYNLQGQMVQQEMNQQHTGNFKMDVTSLPSGIYFAAIKTSNDHLLITEKIIIAH
jgi:hypothetical protein